MRRYSIRQVPFAQGGSIEATPTASLNTAVYQAEVKSR